MSSTCLHFDINSLWHTFRLLQKKWVHQPRSKLHFSTHHIPSMHHLQDSQIYMCLPKPPFHTILKQQDLLLTNLLRPPATTANTTTIILTSPKNSGSQNISPKHLPTTHPRTQNPSTRYTYPNPPPSSIFHPPSSPPHQTPIYPSAKPPMHLQTTHTHTHKTFLSRPPIETSPSSIPQPAPPPRGNPFPSEPKKERKKKGRLSRLFYECV